MAHKTARVVKRKGKPPLIKSPVGPSKRKPKQQTPKLPKPPAGLKWEKGEKFIRGYGGPVRTERAAKKGGTVRSTAPKLKRKPKFAEKTHAEITRKNEPHKRTGDPAPPHPHVGRLKSKRIQDMIEASARRLPLNKKKSPPKPKRKPTVHKRYGGMSHVGLAPAEEARAGTMPQVKRRRYMKKGGTVYRKLGGKVTNGNDVTKMIYRGSS